MHETLSKILDALSDLADAVEDSLPNNEPLSISQNNWSFPGITRSEIRDRVDRSYVEIKTFGSDKLEHNEKRLADYPRRIVYLKDNALAQFPNSSPAVIAAIFTTLDALDKAAAPNLDRDPNVEAIKRVRALNKRLRSREDQLDDLGPKLDDLQEMVERIENAYNSADQLPTDLKSLKEARARINEILTETESERVKAKEARDEIDGLKDKVRKHESEASAVLERCETTYAAATSVGLAAAFSERSRSLGLSVWVWTALLIASLAIAGLLGFWRIQELAATISDSAASDARTFLQFFLSILSVGAPIWFSWLATRQIGQRFRIAEDYAFKAAVSRAYEGYRREAARIDSDMEVQLLGSALSRMDEQPLRLVENDSPSSPFSDLASSKLVENALRMVPGFADQVKDLAGKSLDQAGKLRSKSLVKRPAQQKPAEQEATDEHED